MGARLGLEFSRRQFLRKSGLVAGAAALPAWVLDLEAEEAAAVDQSKLADMALVTARRLGATYADIRINRYRRESIVTREKEVRQVERSQSFGFGVRALLKGAWGFASSHSVTPKEVRGMAERAVEMARANAAFQQKPVGLTAAPKVVARWKGSFEIDPFGVPLDEKVQFLLKLNETALKVKGASYVDSKLEFVNEQKFFASTDGSAIEQYIIRTDPSLTVTAVDSVRGDYQQRRSLPGPKSIGYEYIRQHPWLKEAEEAAEEAVQKLKARSVQPGKYDLVLDPTNLWLTIHESAGHSTELDRALGWEADFAGTSFLSPDMLGRFQFGSKIVNFVADRTQPQGLATVGYDDEGVLAQRWHLVREGIFVDWQTTRELAARMGRKYSYGCCHADSWGSVPFARMPNVSLEPAKSTASADDLIAEVKKGILIYGDGSYSIDQQRYNFQFGGQTFWEIREGKRGAMLRDVAYQSRTPDFWGSCDALGGESTYQLNGSLDDGKGEPEQLNAVSHGCPVARFRQINVLNTGRREGV